jgi:hypothetical protein
MTNRVLNTRTVAALRVGVIVGLLFACGACSPKSSFSAAPPTPPAGRSTEQAWVIASITHDLVNLATFAADPEHWHDLPADAVQVREASSTAPGLAYTLAIELPGGGDAIRSDLKVTDTVWSPELYAPTVRTLCERLKLSPPTNGGVADGLQSDADLLRKLADADTAGMEACNTSLSAWLQAHGLDTRAHEQAALLLGSLAMRENSGLFWDPRGVCNRVVAHLAFARALHPEVSEAGEVAELLVGLILDTKADCQRRIAALQTESATRPELVPWVRAGGLRNARDYACSRLARPRPSWNGVNGSAPLRKLSAPKQPSGACPGLLPPMRRTGHVSSWRWSTAWTPATGTPCPVPGGCCTMH